MIPKWVPIVFFGIPLLSTWLFKLFLEPSLHLNLTQHDVWIHRGEILMLSILTIFYVVIALLMMIWVDSTKKS